ncbi:family 20 glycosylhydrolase [Clostridium swellfunianum]|uniref:beta-N-acetylhexosaminidase n=1 Tax=Clostridium swellfunianum TaxID=1367462 RepID=UPI00202E0055|nr:glycoside hydrolase family 20 zincin-like fold domain-containing protein [Clostridium swellfunianum]MCM0647458.1 family 20 glycosylhydrolase [Clostridium swellfunianum]
MFILPTPKEMKTKDGVFYLESDTEIILHSSCSFENLEIAKLLQREIEEAVGFKAKINKAFKSQKGSIFLKKTEKDEEESYSIDITEEGITINGQGDAGILYGIQTLRQIIRQQGCELSCLTIEDSPYFKYRGYYHDVTRGKVPTLETLKELADRLAFYKINQLQLYIEHTFAFKNLSEAWTGKDPLTAEEILELDAYCKKINIELVPSIATFGHLYEVLSTKSYEHLCELEDSYGKAYSWHKRQAHHTLDVSNEGSIKLVEEMLSEFVPLFSSDKFNICCDETFDLGRGKTQKLGEEVGTGRLYIDFLKKVIKAVKGYDKTVMFWSDIILKYPEYLKEIPEDAIYLNWAYHAGVVENDTKAIAEAGGKQYVCPGVGGWNMLMNALDNAFENIRKMVSFGRKYNALGVLNTDWGDYGHVNLLSNSMPGMIYGAALSWNPDESKTISEIDEAISVLEFGRSNKNIVALMRELSRVDMGKWAHVVWWREYKLDESGQLERQMKTLADIKDETSIKAYHKALQLEKEIRKAAEFAAPNRRLDIEEILVSAKAIALMHGCFLAMKKYELGCSDTQLLMDNSVLAAKLEHWFVEYSKVWRKRNKESELFRIKEEIQFICSQLRSHQEN